MNKRLAIVAAVAATGLALAGCTADPGSTTASNGTATSGASSVAPQKLDKALHDQLPDAIKKAGTVTSVNTGSFPPYTIIGDGSSVTGASADMQKAVGQILGVTIENKTVDGLASVLTGMQAGRYDISFGPVGDFTTRQEQAQFIDWVKEYVVFAVAKGNPKKIVDLESACGAKVAVQAAGSAEAVIQTQSAKCVADGKAAINVQSYKDQPSSILAVQSGRADAFFSSRAPLTYFVKQSNGALELAATDKANGFNDLFQGALVPKESALAKPLLAALEKLHKDGAYAQIMEKWGLKANELGTPGLNLAKH